MRHPTKRSMGRRKDSRGSIRPNDSASQRIKRMREQEHKSKKRSRNKKAGVSSILFVSLLGPNMFVQQRTNVASTSKKRTKSDPSVELSGSSLNPPPFVIRRSIRLVEAWLKDCEKAMAEISLHNATESMVSLLGGGITERPPCNDFIYIYKPIADLSRELISDDNSISKSISSPYGSSFQHSNVRDCVYEKPYQPWKHAPLAERGNKKATMLSKFWEFWKCKNRENGGKGKTSDARTLELACEQHTYNESELFMTGGRSSGLGFSLNALVSQGEKRMYDRCVVHWRSGDKVQHSSMFESASVQSLSSDNISHQHFQPSQFSSTEYDTFHCTKPRRTMSSSTSWSRLSSLNMGSIIERSMSPTALVQREAREEEERLAAERGRPRTPSPFRPTTPRPIQPWKPRTPLIKRSFDDLKISPQEPDRNNSAALTMPESGHQPKSTNPVRERATSIRETGGSVKDQKAIPGPSKQVIQAFATNGERNRDKEVSGCTRKYGSAVDKWTKIDDGTDTFTKNRERRRAGRRATGHIMNMRDEQMMTTSGDKKVAKRAEAGNGMRSEGQDGTAWNPDDEPVASGYEWEKRMKRRQPSGSKLHSDKYRREDREKYWARK
jgi:hypothetical protein